MARYLLACLNDEIQINVWSSRSQDANRKILKIEKRYTIFIIMWYTFCITVPEGCSYDRLRYL